MDYVLLCELSHKAIASSSQGLDISWCFDFVSQDFTEPFDIGVETVFEVDEGVGGPEALANLFAGNQLAGLFEQDGEDFDGLALQFELEVVPPQFFSVWVEGEGAEADFMPLVVRLRNGHKKASGK
jgi:hypothetical protein